MPNDEVPNDANYRMAALSAWHCLRTRVIHDVSNDTRAKLRAMRPHRDLVVADAAEQLAAEVIRLVDRTPRLLHKQQLLKSTQSLSANIAEGFGRVTKPERNNRLAIARGESEEAIRHLRANFAGRRIASKDYWPLHNRIVTIVKMINSLLS